MSASFWSRFFPLCLAQFISALNDNVVKNAIVLAALFSWPDQKEWISAAGMAAFVGPGFLFSAMGGHLADRYPKDKLAQILKGLEIPLMAVALLVAWAPQPWSVVLIAFLLGTHAAFFGPVKYAILPELVGPKKLVSANAAIESTTFLAILGGTVLGGLAAHYVGGPFTGPMIASAAAIALSVIGFLAVLRLPRLAAGAPALFPWNPITDSWRTVREAFQTPSVRLTIWGMSWFWGVGALMLTSLPVFVTALTGGGALETTWALSSFVIGIGLGSIGCARLMGDRIDARLSPIAAVAMALIALDIAWIVTGTPVAGLANLVGVHLLIALALFAAAGGVFVVPLYAILQRDAPPAAIARAVAANNIVNAGAMVIGAGVAYALPPAGQLFLVAATGVIAAYCIVRGRPGDFGLFLARVRKITGKS
jgi:MFS family permease